MSMDRTFKPPAAVAKAAKLSLELNDKKPAGTPVGWARARQLSNRDPVSLDTIGRMVKYFHRHMDDYKSKDAQAGKLTKGRVAWLFWGGNPGLVWAKNIVKEINKERKEKGEELLWDDVIDDIKPVDWPKLKDEDVKEHLNLDEGGPGSGVKYNNTQAIDYPLSEYVSVGTRKGMLDNMEYEEFEIPIAQVTKVAQKNFVPAKLTRMIKNPDVITSKPIDVLWVRGEGYHVIDGHHRFLAARKLKMETIPARVRRKSEKTMPAEKQNGFTSWGQATIASGYMEQGDWSEALKCFRGILENEILKASS